MLLLSNNSNHLVSYKLIHCLAFNTHTIIVLKCMGLLNNNVIKAS